MVTTPPATLTRLPRTHAVLLVLAVLALHLALLAGAPDWRMPAHEPTQTRTPVFTTRQIVREATPPAATARPSVARTETPPLASHTPPEPAAASAAPPLAEDIAAQLTAPVALPERSASAVDLPPFPRSVGTPDNTVTEATAFRPPASARLQYGVQGLAKGLRYFASGELLWRQDGAHYEARLEVGAFLLGSRVQTSRGDIGAEGLMPTRFGDKTRSELAAHFQRDKGIVSFSANTPDVPLLKGAQDRLSIVLQLSALLAADAQRFPPGTMLSFQTVSQREAEVWQFKVEPPETLELPYGRLDTLKLNRQPRREFDQQIEIWFAPALGHLPVRLRITNANGDQVDQQLRSVEAPDA